MNIEEIIDECNFNLKQIRKYDPDPYFVNYFFCEFLNGIRRIYDGIFEEANRDFGLFISGKCTKEKFKEKAISKKDEKAVDFVIWFEMKDVKEHERSFPNFIKNTIQYQDKFKKLPKIKIMLRAKNRYRGDITQEILVKTKFGRIESKEDLQIEIKRQLPGFLKIINKKRNSNNEPKIKEEHVTASAFLNLGSNEKEIGYASELYIPVMNRLLTESREKIRQLTIQK